MKNGYLTTKANDSVLAALLKVDDVLEKWPLRRLLVSVVLCFCN